MTESDKADQQAQVEEWRERCGISGPLPDNRADADLRLAWQPMETAPSDGREVLLMVEKRAGATGKCLVGHYMPGGHCIDDHPPIEKGWYFWTGHAFDKAATPIYWMELPEVDRALSPPVREKEALTDRQLRDQIVGVGK